MKSAKVYCNGILTGILSKSDDNTYVFRYDDNYFQGEDNQSISLTLPKKQQEHFSETLFSFFINLLSEGKNNSIQAQKLHLSKNDYFELLLASAKFDTIGAIVVEEILQ